MRYNFFQIHHNSDYNIVKFLERNQNGYYPDRENNFLLEIEDGNYYLVDKVKHEKIKIEADYFLMLNQHICKRQNTTLKFWKTPL